MKALSTDIAIVPLTSERAEAVRRLVGESLEILKQVDQIRPEVTAPSFASFRALELEVALLITNFLQHLKEINALPGTASGIAEISEQDFEDAIHGYEGELAQHLSPPYKQTLISSLSWEVSEAMSYRMIVLRLIGTHRRSASRTGRTGHRLDSCTGLSALSLVLLTICMRKLLDGKYIDCIPLLVDGMLMSGLAQSQRLRGLRTAAEEAELRREVLGAIGKRALSKRHDKTRELADFAGKAIHALVADGHLQKQALQMALPQVQAKARELGITISEDRFLDGPTGKNWHTKYRKANQIPISKRGRRNRQK